MLVVKKMCFSSEKHLTEAKSLTVKLVMQFISPPASYLFQKEEKPTHKI